ncbi:MAG: hypothetical protein ACI8XO_002114 [Verrucomicrobiales bacterium]|jgi:hypothetical protein
MQNSNTIITIIVLVVAGVFAIFLGTSIGSEDQQTPVMFITGIAIIALMLGLGKNLWMLLLVLWPLAGRVAVLPVPFSVSNLVVMFVVVGAILMIALGGFSFRGSMTLIDLGVAILMADIALVFLMNPVGLSSLGSATVGSRPYFEIFLAFLAYVVLRNQAILPRQSKSVITAILVTMAVLSLGKTLSYYVPGIGYNLRMFYTDFISQQEALDPSMVNLVGASRNSILLDISQAIILTIIAFSNPLKAMLPIRPLRFVLLGFAFAGILISGFRSLFFLSGCYVIIGAYIWGRGRALIATGFVAFAALVCVYAVNAVHPLPLGVQRAFSFLPGDWGEDAKVDSAGSSEWRYEMWNEALFGNKLIENKFVGDGFGFSAQEMEAMEDARMGNNLDAAIHEHMMLVGGFHSGPISTIRFVGILGLILFSVFVCILSVKAWRLISDARGSPLFPIAIYFCVPIFFMPVFFFFIFGGFEGALPHTIYSAGVFMMLRNSLKDHKEAQEKEKEKVDEPVPEGHPGGLTYARSA